MEINITKSGLWAIKGIEVVNVKKGIHGVSIELADDLLENGWAEPAEKVETVDTETQTEAEDIDEEPEVELVEKGSAGWWAVTFKGHDEIKVRGADNEKEAVTLAKAKLEVA